MEKKAPDNNKARSLNRRKFLVLTSSALTAGASTLAVSRAAAQSATYPDHPVSVIVAYAPGSATDIIARVFATELHSLLGQNFVVESKPGASGMIGAAALARSNSDGSTLSLISPAVLTINPWVYKNLTYDPLKDFTPVIKLATASSLLLVPAQSPATSVRDLMRLMKERKQGNYMQYNSAGNGTTQHLQAVLLAKLADATAQHVPYSSVSNQLNALVTGEVDFSLAVLPAASRLVKSGRIRALAITSAERSAVLPDVPTFRSAGFDVFEKTGIWWGIIGPKAMPEAITQALHSALAKVLGNPGVQEKLANMGFEAERPAPASEFAQFIRVQHAFMEDLVKRSGTAIQ